MAKSREEVLKTLQNIFKSEEKPVAKKTAAGPLVTFRKRVTPVAVEPEIDEDEEEEEEEEVEGSAPDEEDEEEIEEEEEESDVVVTQIDELLDRVESLVDWVAANADALKAYISAVR